MKHDLSIEGYAYRLRPISLEDARFVVKLRTDASLGKYLNSTSTKISDQESYIRRYYERVGDYYFVIEKMETREQEGLIAIYDLDDKEKTAEWGRWIIKPSSMAGLESAYLIYKVSFDLLDLKTVYCRTIAKNERVVSFHDSCGLTRNKILKNYAEIDGVIYDSIEHSWEKKNWLESGLRLEKLILRLSDRK